MYELAKGTILQGKNKYVVEQVLGQGGFGFTYLVSAMIMNQNIPVRTRFAVKEFFLKSHCMRDERDHCTMTYAQVAHDEVQRCHRDFRTEAQRLVSICEMNRKSGSDAAFTNHHIVPVNECFEANGTSYFVMEYLSGGSLRSRVQEQGMMSEVQALSWVRPIAEAVDFLHSLHVLHMDIKPENIVMRSGGEAQPDTPMLIDFGISLHFDGKGVRTTLSNTSGLSPGYSPLEQSQPITSFDPRVDVYALAATTFYLLTGKDPANAAEVNETYIRQTLPESVSERTKSAIVHAMQPLRTQRTPTAGDFIRELAASYTMPVGHILHGPMGDYRITRIVDSCDSHIQYEARRADLPHETLDAHATRPLGQAATGKPTAATGIWVVLEQFAHDTSTRNADGSVALGNISMEQRQAFTAAVEAASGLTDRDTLPAMARGKGGMVEALCFETAGTCYCAVNDSFRPQSALAKSLNSVTSEAGAIANQVTTRVRPHAKWMAALLLTGCVIAAGVVFVTRLLNSVNNQPDAIEQPADTTATQPTDTITAPATTEAPQAEEQPKTPSASMQQTSTPAEVEKATTTKPEARQPKTNEESNAAIQPAATRPAATQPTPDPTPSPAATSTTQADKQARAMLSKLKASGTQPSGADMKRLNALRDNASPEVKAQIDAFNEKWGW